MRRHRQHLLGMVQHQRLHRRHHTGMKLDLPRQGLRVLGLVEVKSQAIQHLEILFAQSVV